MVARCFSGGHSNAPFPELSQSLLIIHTIAARRHRIILPWLLDVGDQGFRRQDHCGDAGRVGQRTTRHLCRVNDARLNHILDKAAAMVRLVRWWLPDREIILVGDGAYASNAFASYLHHFARPVTLVSRFYLDAALYGEPYAIPLGRTRVKGNKLPSPQAHLEDPTSVWTRLTLAWYDGLPRPIEYLTGTALWYRTGSVPVSLRWVLVRDPLGKFDPQCFFCTLSRAFPLQILTWFILRWCVETTFEEVRAHLGVETQRQGSSLAIQRTTPLLLGLFSFITLLTDRFLTSPTCPTRTAAWYAKPAPTFSDAIALVRRTLWLSATFCTPSPTPLVHKVPPWLVERLLDTLCYAA
jgi:hypothetical protein